MDAQDFRSLQEAYNQVYQVDEELTGERKERALKKGGYLANRVATGREGQPVERRNRSGDITMRTTTKAPTKRGGGESKKVRKSDWSGWEADRGSGNKAARRESYNLYDIILSHLLDEGYAETPESAEAIMVNMSEEWRENIMIAEGMTMRDFKANRQKNKRRDASADAVKRGHVGKEWYNSGRRYSPDEAKRMRSKLDDEERRTRHRSAVEPDNENDDDFSADKTKNPKKLRKQKAMGEH